MYILSLYFLKSANVDLYDDASLTIMNLDFYLINIVKQCLIIKDLMRVYETKNILDKKYRKKYFQAGSKIHQRMQNLQDGIYRS